MGNAAIFPLIYNRGSKDVILIHISPIERKKLPKTAAEIFNRVNEISFNSSLMREMRAVSFVTRLIDDQKIRDKSVSRILIHSIFADDVLAKLGVASKFNTSWRFLEKLHDVGCRSTDPWLSANYD